MSLRAETLPTSARAIQRGDETWYSYLLFGLLNYLLAIQGNVIPFLQVELHLSYRIVSLHSSAIAIGMIVIGLFGERLSRMLGRQKTLWLGAGGMATGAGLLCLAPAAWASIASCGIMGLLSALVPSIVPAFLSDIHKGNRDTAFAEATAISYAFSILAPLATSLCIVLAIGWAEPGCSAVPCPLTGTKRSIKPCCCSGDTAMKRRRSAI